MLFSSATFRCFFNLLTGGNYFIAREVKVFLCFMSGIFFHNCCARTWSEIPISPCMRWLSRSVSRSLSLSFTVYLRPDPAWPGLSALSTSPVWSGTVRLVDRCGNVSLCGTRNRVVNVVGQMDVYCLVKYRRVHRYFLLSFFDIIIYIYVVLFFSFFILFFFCVFTLNWM